MKRLAIAIIFVGVTTTWAQESKRPGLRFQGKTPPLQVKKFGEATLAPSALKIVTKPAKRHTPKALTENGLPSGKPVNPQLSVSLPKGKSAKSGDLVNGTNGLESNLNSLGYSLYENENDAETPVVTLKPVTLDLDKQSSDFRKSGGMKTGAMPSTGRNISTELSNVAVKPIKASASMPVTPKVVNETITLFKKDFGDPDWFAINFDSSLTKHGDMKLRKLVAKADIDAYLIGKKASIFHARAEVGGNRDLGAKMELKTPGSFGGPKTIDDTLNKGGKGKRGGKGGRGGKSGGATSSPSGNSSSTSSSGYIDLEATLLGDDLFTPVHKTVSGRATKKISSKPMNWEYSVHIPIIPAVNAVGTIGAKGTMGVDFVCNADSSGGDISIIPNFNASIYAQVGIEVNLLVASVEGGLGANLTLIDYDLKFEAGIGTTVVEKGGKSYSAVVAPVTVSHTLNTLKGNLYGYAKVGYWLPFKTHEKTLWRGDLFKWSGFTDSRTLYSDEPDPVIVGNSNMKAATIKL